MRGHVFTARTTLIATVSGLLLMSSACATVKNAASVAAGREVAERVDRGVSAAADGAEGAVLNGEEPAQTPADPNPGTVGSPTAETAPPSVTSNFDFEPGERVLFNEDFASENMGDFPRSLVWKRGTLEVVELDGARFVRAASGNAALSIPLGEALPERFTIEMDVYNPAAPYGLIMSTGALPAKTIGFKGEPHLQWSASAFNGHGLIGSDGSRLAVQQAQVDAVRGYERAPVTARVMVDDQHMKLYWGDQRIANVPQVELARGEAIHLVFEASPSQPIYVGNIRVAAGGRDLYAVLEREGRFTARGIEFDTGSDRIRPTSTETLDEIGLMLQEHMDLELVIEGHTDAEGSESSNRDLSERRAASVRAYLIENYGVHGGRLESVGFGEAKPVASNETAEGRQENRRVELVRAGGDKSASPHAASAPGTATSTPMATSATAAPADRAGQGKTGSLRLTMGTETTDFEVTYCSVDPRQSGQNHIEADLTAVGTFRGHTAALFLWKVTDGQFENIDIYLKDLSADVRALPPMQAYHRITETQRTDFEGRYKKLEADFQESLSRTGATMEEMTAAGDAYGEQSNELDREFGLALPWVRYFGSITVEGTEIRFQATGQKSINPDEGVAEFAGLPDDVRVVASCGSTDRSAETVAVPTIEGPQEVLRDRSRVLGEREGKIEDE